MQVLEQWVMLLDERGLRATGMELLIRVENGKAPSEDSGGSKEAAEGTRHGGRDPESLLV